MVGAIVYGLCAVTALTCTWLLIGAYRRGRARLLLWSGLAFAGLTLNNILLVLDKFVFVDIDLSVLRTSVALVAMAVLLFGLIWRDE
jgi:hypothetical protein